MVFPPAAFCDFLLFGAPFASSDSELEACATELVTPRAKPPAGLWVGRSWGLPATSGGSTVCRAPTPTFMGAGPGAEGQCWRWCWPMAPAELGAGAESAGGRGFAVSTVPEAEADPSLWVRHPAAGSKIQQRVGALIREPIITPLTCLALTGLEKTRVCPQEEAGCASGLF